MLIKVSPYFPKLGGGKLWAISSRNTYLGIPLSSSLCCIDKTPNDRSHILAFTSLNLAKQFDEMWETNQDATLITPDINTSLQLPSRKFKEIKFVPKNARDIQNTCIMYGVNMLLVFEIENSTELSAYIFCTDPPVAISRYMLEKDWEIT